MAYNPQEQQRQTNPSPLHMDLSQTQTHSQAMNPNMNPQQSFSAYPQYPLHSMHNQMSYTMPSNHSPFNQNYSQPLQNTYPPPYQPYYGLQPMQQSPAIISPFQQQQQQHPPNNMTQNNNNTINTINTLDSKHKQQSQQSLQRFNFQHNDMQQAPNEEEKEILLSSTLQQQQQSADDDDEAASKPRLEYSKIPRLGPKHMWFLGGKQPLHIDTQIEQENKIFGDIETVYNEMKDNNSVSVLGNTIKQNIRLFLQNKANVNEPKEDETDDCVKVLQPLLVYENNIRPDCAPFNEYNRYGLLRIPPVSSYPSTPAITITLHLYDVQFKDLAAFTVEDYLTQQIIFDYKIYTNCLQNDKEFGTKITLLKSKINQLLAMKQNALQLATDTKMECITLLDELVSIRQKKDELQSQIAQLFTKIYMNWRNIHSWRHKEGMNKFSTISAPSSTIYQGTKLMLYLKKIEPNRVQQQLQYKEALMAELDEIETLIRFKNSIENQQHIKFDETSIMQNITMRQNTHLMAPGTVHYVAYIDVNASDVTQTSLCSTTERFRRRQLTNYAVHANIFVNNDAAENNESSKRKRVKITKTNKIYTSFPNFSCELQFELELKLIHKPISIEIELRSNAWLSSKPIANIEIPITTQLIKEQCDTSQKMRQCETMFESDINIIANRYITSEDYKTYIEPANGAWDRKICGAIAYGLQIDATDEYTSKLQPELLSVHVVSDKNDISESKQHVDEEEEVVESENFVLVEDHVTTFRQKILKLRQRYAISEKEAVPLLDSDIPDHLYKAVHDETKQEIAYRNEMILDRMNHATMDVSEVVCEPHIDLLPCFSFSIYSLFKPRRRLRPKRSYFESKATINPDVCRIMIQVLQSKYLPIRQSDNMMQQMRPAMNMNTVEPFIEVAFMGNKCRTFTSFGSNARWEQTLCVEFVPPGNHKYTPSNLQRINEDIEINVYDEWIISKAPEDDRATNSQIQRREKRYLGSIKIPFTAIYFNPNIEGVFKLNVPLILLGYNHTQTPQRQQPLISLFATLDPPICNQFNDNFNNEQRYYEWLANHSDEEEKNNIYPHCIQWTKSIKNSSQSASNRSLEVFVSNSRNECELICRYLRAVEPPMQVTPEIFIRFVACIPYKEDIHLIPGARDVWMNNSDFMKLGSGDNEEHANLLACYFMWLDEQNPNSGWSTYIAMGKGIINGDKTMYVLRRKATLKHCGGVSVQNVLLYDASEGLSYAVPVRDAMQNGNGTSDLIDISMVYNAQQIYGNLQADIDPSSDSFIWEFENKQCWKPLFDKKWISEDYCLPSLQEGMLQYTSSPNEYYMKRQNKLEYIIEKQFDSWRDLPTKWNYAICKTLREILVQMEPLCQNGGNIPVINQDPQIFAISQIYTKMYGFPLNIKDNGCDNILLESDDNKAVSLVYNTKVHENDDPNAEFARAVYIYPYTNKIASVWIYIASLSKH